MEKYLAKDKKLHASFMDLVKVYNSQVECFTGCVEDIWGRLQLLDGVKAFHIGANACARVDGELRESFGIHAGVTQGCVISLWLLNMYMDRVMLCDISVAF